MSRVQTIQQTGKGWKLLHVLSVLAILIGVVLFFSGDRMHAALFILPGIIGYVVARIGAWWCHG